MNKKLAFAAFAVAGVMASTSASAACVGNVCTYVPGDTEFQTSGDTTFPITGQVSADIGRNGVGSGTFTDIYQFIVDINGIGSGSFSTSLSGPGTNIDFTSATFNGLVVTLTPTGDIEFGGRSGIAITAGALNQLIINYTSDGLGSYGGNLSFTPGAVPEPAAWALMIGGFGMVGGTLRRRRARVQFA
ncbi:PEP-CTERM sorting domain-containing protein [Microvirga sp. SRT01]|jgi:hypothetical protein|uniref:PEP-CTERM sorting domain-containing protein n=1 Tax=Sphingomonas longa TaxID=2778730 RepID=A0ABS2D9M1_9SPHN|nr:MULTISPECIES: FxDxF family PEP-CTERM protein [Alphaproteobacteria]MBM6577628.1 PEP-CTERM sorting domain-containing protein [Sphingomonas sp. BT552]MBR7710673.1 PEP-CTERM sorting domain-containing protein [Microvirga sp. SRT01]